MFSIFIQNFRNESFSSKLIFTWEFFSHLTLRKISVSYASSNLFVIVFSYVFSLRLWKFVTTPFVLTYTHVYRNISRNVKQFLKFTQILTHLWRKRRFLKISFRHLSKCLNKQLIVNPLKQLRNIIFK